MRTASGRALPPAHSVEEIGQVAGLVPGTVKPCQQPCRDCLARLIEARLGASYALQVRNRGARRLGLVIAVDGRNIVSGQHSDLGPEEAMYVLGPYQQARYAGWRTSATRVHRFFFTDATDS